MSAINKLQNYLAQNFDADTQAEVMALARKIVAEERDRAARLAEGSRLGEHEDGGNPHVPWSIAVARSARLGHLVAEAIRTSPEAVQARCAADR